eukprot:SAG11_NODE_393_length_9833_cov_34.748458_3_plen_354_part_00
MPLLSLIIFGSILGFAAATTTPAPPLPPELALRTSVENGLLGYSVLVDGAVWLTSSNSTNVVWVDTAERLLCLTGPAAPAKTAGADAMGPFESTSFSWDAGGIPISTQFREYKSADPPAIVFALSYPRGAPRTNRPDGDSTPSASFPAFASEGGKLPGLGYRSWSGNMCADMASVLPLNYSQVVGGAAINSIANGPMALYSSHDGPCIFLSPHSQFMTEQHRATPGPLGSLFFGPGGELTSLPEGFTQETVLVLGRGITATTLGWGRHARAVHSPPRPKLPDLTLQTLGYWTGARMLLHASFAPSLAPVMHRLMCALRPDNGAYYYFYGRHPSYRFEPEQVLRTVMQGYRSAQ